VRSQAGTGAQWHFPERVCGRRHPQEAVFPGRQAGGRQAGVSTQTVPAGYVWCGGGESRGARASNLQNPIRRVIWKRAGGGSNL